jgi:predicted hotdog family 3-hydroxylacyl-ACP dehydratase
VNPGRADIERMLEHAGDMCLLTSVTTWDEQQIRCSAPAPQAGHPLMRDGRLPAIAGAEYAAQAAALHGALLDSVSTPRPGMLANVRDVTFHRTWFPAGDESLTVQATVLSRSDSACMYSFDVASGREAVTSGSLMVVFLEQAGSWKNSRPP